MEDVSRTTIVSLVVLTLVVSMVGTWVVLDEMSRTQPQYMIEPVSAGNINLEILTPQEYTQQIPVDEALGNIAIEVQEAP